LRSETAQPGPFRQAALDRINNPEQLDRLLTVTTARSWIALAAVAGIIAVALGWSVIGRLATNVDGRGLFIQKGGRVASAAAPGAGTLERLFVEKGDSVEAHQIIAKIVAPDAEQQLANLRSLVVERKEELQRQQSYAAAEITEKRAGLGLREADLRQIQVNAQRRAEALRAKAGDEQRLLAEKVVTRTAVLQTQAQLDQSLQEAADTASQVTQLAIQLKDLDFQAQQRVKNAEFALADAQRHLDERVAANRTGSDVRAPVGGTVDEIQLHPGSLVGHGQSVLTIETPGEGLEFLLFVPLLDGDKIRVGQSVRIAPNWTVREEEGTMLGSVIQVSKYPVTPERLRTLLFNEDLVRHFSGAGPVFLVRVRLRRDPASRSGYAWTSSRGAEVPVASGSFAGAEVAVKSQRPIGLMIPALRRWTGI
jgi:HlyD family secretion protein